MFRKILCPIDFAASSQYALRMAARIAAARDAELVLAHVWYVTPLAAGEVPVPAEALTEMLDDEQRALEDAVRVAVELGATRVSSRLLTGVPWDRIVDAVRQDRSYDLIVIGTHGRTGVARWMLGSVAEKVVRHASCSVLVARGRGTAGTFRHALCPVDFSESSHAAVEEACALVVPGGPGVDVIHVLEPQLQHPMIPPADGLQYDVEKAVTLQLDELVASTNLEPGVVIHRDMRVGNPASEVLTAIDDDDSIDLVAVGTHGRTGIHRVLVGSVAEKIVRHAACPVLVARQRS